MKINKLKIPKAKLASMDDDQKFFFLYVGHLRNELTMLQGILNLTSSYLPENENLGTVNSSMSLLMIRLLAGKLSEGWQFLQDSYFPKATIARMIEPKLESDSKDALEKLKQYFSRENRIHGIRNHFAFHYSSENAAKAVDELEKHEYWEVIMKEGQTPVFATAEEIVSQIMYEEVDSNPDKAMEKLFREVFTVTRNFKLFCDGCLANMIDNSVPHDLYTEEIIEIKKENALTTPVVFGSSKHLF